MTVPPVPHRPLRAPRTAGLYDPAHEHDGCGVACVARLDGDPRHDVVELGLAALDDLEHRGAAGADPTTGDGAGVLLSLPHGFLRARVREFGLRRDQLPDPGRVAVANVFLSRNPTHWAAQEQLIEQAVLTAGQLPLGWREVPHDLAACGRSARDVAPEFRQLLVGAGDDVVDQDEFERQIFVARRIAELEAGAGLSIPSFSSRTIVYKGMLTARQLSRFYADLRDPELQSPVAVVHSRFSTNTFPSWELAQPLRLLGHNGEINTLAGNVNWMRAREAALHSNLFGDDLQRCLPLIPEGSSDSAAFDRVLELLTLAGRPLTQAMMMMIPAAYASRDDMPPELEAFYRYSASVIEPWDGPAAMVFSDGRVVGACLDRNGLRPGRWLVTNEGVLVVGSEAGVLPVDPAKVVRRGRLHPGRLLIADLERGVLHADGEAELEVARQKPYGEWLAEGEICMSELADRTPVRTHEPLRTRQLAFGYSQEDLRVLISPAAAAGIEPTGSMGNDLALAALSEREPSLFSYFKQRFAQVTNPPIDSVRESIVMSLESRIGSEGNMLSEGPEHAIQLVLDHPVLTNDELERVARASHAALRSTTLDATWPLAAGTAGLEAALARIAREASAAITGAANLIVISDRGLSADRVPIPAMLALGAVHQHLVAEGTRLQTSLVVETGEAREIHHLAALIGYGAAAVNPYLLLDSLADLHGRAELPGDLSADEARDGLLRALRKGLLKVMSKMGIATIQSYCGAQVFEAVGLDRDLVDRYFGGTPSAVGGVGLSELAREALERHARAYPEQQGRSLPEHVEDSSLPAAHASLLPQGGVYAWRRDGERHAWDPETISALQLAVGKNGNKAPQQRRGSATPPQGAHDPDPERYEDFARRVDLENGSLAMLRGLLEFRSAGESIPLESVEPVTEILKRFTTGGMSLGALGPEAHETLAVAMNRIGGMSNSGEGGEDIRRNTPDPNGDQRRSRIKQVASGRFGVTVHYLSSADQIQIKISQGAKPGEGGQLPGHKIDPYIAQLRFATPGVGLISPPPHHDIYSIEDLKQLIYDLRAANPGATVSVKLAAEAGVGTVAAGVAKAGADHVVIAGHDGGTGASPLSSIQQAGVPWEIGLAETQQTLLRNDLRSRITVQVDGGMRTGRDVLVGAMLGADEYGFSTAPLIATGCIMMRVCHLNTCPVGVATQDPELRARFSGRPEHVVNFLYLVAEDVRRHLAEIGIPRLEDAIGRVELLTQAAEPEGHKRQLIDLSDLLVFPGTVDRRAPRRRTRDPEPPDEHFDVRELLPEAEEAIVAGDELRLERPVTNVDRTVGGRISHTLVSAHGPSGIDDDTISIRLLGSAGQSFGAWLAPGITLELEGEANDYVGKGLSGGVLAIHPPAASPYVAAENVIIGNVALYGATSGRAFLSGLAGERFAVRNSGALCVVEGVGDHGCEYMTGGRAAVLGPTGHNFAAGMSGGIAWVHDPDGHLPVRANTELVDLEPLTDEDALELEALVTEHLARTGSEVAARLLADWQASLAEFVRVIPREYAQALERRDELGGPKTSEFRTLAACESRRDPRAFMEWRRVPDPERDPAERVADYGEIFGVLPAHELQLQGARCMDCGVPFCNSACPLGNLIPDWNDLVRRDDWEEACEQLHATNNFPEFTGLICPAPCESACVLAIDDDPVMIKQIEYAIVNRGFEEGWIVARPPERRTGKRLAVIGSGPAGLAAAAELNQVGHHVTVYERDEAPGGLMRFGVPDAKLEKWMIDRRVALLEAEGIEFEFGSDVGGTVDAAELAAAHDAVVVAIGSRVERDFEPPGRELAGVHFAMDYLYQRNRWVARAGGREAPEPTPGEEITAAGKHVVVIGGGDTGMDCVSNANREGALSATLLDVYPELPASGRYPDSPWPLAPKRSLTTYALDEGGERRFGHQVTGLAGNGRVQTLRGRQVTGSSSRALEPVPGSEFEVPADLVLIAIGFLHPAHDDVIAALELGLDKRGNVAAPAFATSRAGVYAAGDARVGQSLIVTAIAEGRRCARAIDRRLRAASG